MEPKSTTFALENGLDLKQLVSTGSVLHINEDYDDNCIEAEKSESKQLDFIGQPVANFQELEKSMTPVDENGFVKKKVVEEGGGLPVCDGNTVSVAFSGYWQDSMEPFDAQSLHKPLVVDLKDNGLLPGFERAIRSMLVGELSIFLFTHDLMYGEMGVPPRIKPRARSIFYVKLLKSIFTAKEGKIDFSEPNMFRRVHHEVKMLYSSGMTLYKTQNFPAGLQLFRKAVFMLHKCRLADETEEKVQEKMLIKLYMNLAICYNKTKQPLKACTACNELNRLNSLWNNGKALFQNAKALRMIGQFDAAENRLRRAMKLCNNKDIEAELKLLLKSKETCNQSKIFVKNFIETNIDLVTDNFKKEVENLIKNFKENNDLCKLIMPQGLNSSEVAYIKEVCIRENLFFNKIKTGINCDGEDFPQNKNKAEEFKENYALDKYEDNFSSTTKIFSDENDYDEQVLF
ncbi:unnamed protein product [Chilo suppressalis]|uniref:peptidylprolyl isomerase n=1 Tax=Chilo suppressalis TaxID=168631 RepID=A0ABN8BDK6_CHISP|nr:hypothetical protein evm_002163 [Chilo suppressalis]CAH0404648.1 unnamed protein product [Chilo suppressalis]